LTKPYLTPVPNCEQNCRGNADINQEKVNELFLKCYKNNVQIFSHCNGDAAIDMMIEGHKKALEQLPDKDVDRRTVIVHSQVMRPDQLDSYKTCGFFALFFTISCLLLG
jgi:predicted amidohydrolase YtcJ